MSGHTPGPWHWSRGRGIPTNVVVDAEGSEIAEVWLSDDDRYRATQIATGDLIAAAPDLLEDLRAARDWIDRNMPEDSDGGNALIAAIDNTIAKAEGRS